ncbi:MAG: hypothetical protein EOO96_19095 [Pedobacter sp.]|nr:MAG: hypothetical protein EOO96_19095 [Pedobacter sp.]
MKRYFKGCLIVIGVLLLVLAVFVGLFWWSMENNKANAESDAEELSKACDTVKYITENPYLTFIKFVPKELKTLRFQILRDGKISNDTLVKTSFNKNSDLRINFPYKKFLKTDTIILTTQNQLKYYVSGYGHYAYLHYGMFGYVGSSDCRFSENCIINNQVSSGIIDKFSGWINPEKSKHIRTIPPSGEEYQAFVTKCKINLKEAEQIFINQRKNEHLYSVLSYGIEVGPKESFYVFGEERESNRDHIDIVKINTQTGKFIRYTNYPFDSDR